MTVPLSPASLFDPIALAIVLGGTALATLLRCGLGDVGRALGTLVNVMTGAHRFDTDEVRARIARQLQAITRDGLLRAEPRPTGDAEFDAALDELYHRRSPAAMQAAMDRARQTRHRRSQSAAGTLMQAADLAPVFGLAGTLVSLSHLPPGGIDRGAYMSAIAMAVHATLYGLIAANLLLAPLSRMVDRVCSGEDEARREIVDWLMMELDILAGPQHAHAAPGNGAGHGAAHGHGTRAHGPGVRAVAVEDAAA